MNLPIPNAPPPVVLVHGMWSCQRTWGRTHQTLTQQGHTVLPYELPEHGQRHRSAAALGRLGIRDYVADLVHWVKQQAQVPILVGHSMGGLISLMAAAELGRQGIKVPGVIMVTPATPAGGWAFSLSNLFVFFRPCLLQLAGWRAFRLTAWEARFGLYHAAKSERRQALSQSLQPESGRALMQIAWWFLDPTRSTRVNWADIDCPVRVYLGGQDRIVPTYAARVLQRLNDVEVALNTSSSHMVFDDPTQNRFFEWLAQQIKQLTA